MVRALEGAALLVAGHGAIGGTKLDVSAVHTLGQIGESLLATGAGWKIRRLSAAAGERHGADRGSLKRHLDELCAEEVRVAVLVILGVIAESGGPAIVTSSELRAYPEDATLPLAWIGERLRKIKAEQLLVVMSGRPDASFASSAGATPSSSPRGWLGAIGTQRKEDVIAVASSEGGAPLVDALLAGLCGEALDRRTGTVTMKSISDYLGKRVPAALVQTSEHSQTLAASPPLAGLWDVRRSQLSLLHTQRRGTGTGEVDELTGTVLPGRFRLDSIVARGTFGTVYRAHQLAVERDVAVKVLHPDIDPTSEDGRLFVHEVRAVGRIDHPNVVRIHQADITQDGRLFYAMELLDGRDLQAVVADGIMPRERAIDLTCQLLRGLGAAHEAGLVHADIKPANAIVVAREGAERVVLVDFGLARLRAPGRAAESAGGTPAYMAPEQLDEGRVDARSDLFSAALVLFALLTNWRRPNAKTKLPPFEQITDADLRRVLEKALALDPAERYQSAPELAAALTGTAVAQSSQPLPIALLPFRSFAPLTEADRGRLQGRETDVASLTEHVIYRRSLVYTAPSGTGKTSLLRAGLVPRLEALGTRVVYYRCRNASAAALAAAIDPTAPSVAIAVANHVQQRGAKLVIVLDQLEAALAEGDLVEAALGFAHWPANADVSVVLSVREDHLARLMARAQPLEPGISIMRLPPLSIEGARAAINAPLAEARLAIEPELLETLVTDLRDAAAALAPELGWGDAPAVYPPHLQLACSVLYEALGAGEATLTLAHYKRLGGFAAIVGEHLERVLDVELAGGRDAIARDILVALVTTHHERAMRAETELLAMVGKTHGAEPTTAVLEILRQRGLLVRVRGDEDASWELVHDSLVPRVEAWIDRRDLARRRAVELVRYHVRRSQPEAPSLLGRGELREVRAHDEAIAELDREWRASGRDDVWTPSQLVAHSRRVLRRRTLMFASIVIASLGVAGGAVARNRIQEAKRSREQSLVDRDIGRFTIELAPFDWDPTTLRIKPVSARLLKELAWEARHADPQEPESAGVLFETRSLVRGSSSVDETLRQSVEAPGGHAFVVISGRGREGQRCSSSIVPITIPGFAQRVNPATVRILVPTCDATKADLVPIAAGTFIYGGVGDPPSPDAQADPALALEQRVELPAFMIDRREVANAQFSVFAEMSGFTGIRFPSYPKTREIGPGEPDHPVAGITWFEARAFCRWLGKGLPTSQQWVRAMRGGERLADGSENPMPRRNLPWGAPRTPIPARIYEAEHPGTVPVGSYPDDRSPDGVLDLAGNVVEWTDTVSGDGIRLVRGGGAIETESFALLLDMMGPENPRPVTLRYFDVGARCVLVE